MKADSLEHKITSASLSTLFKVLFLGILVGEAWFLSQALARPLNLFIDAGNHEHTAFLVVVTSVLLLGWYFHRRECWPESLRILKSYRADLLVVLILGILISYSFTGIGENAYIVAANYLSIKQLLTLLFVPHVLGTLLVLRARHLQKKSEKPQELSFFVSDLEKVEAKDDLLDFSEKASRFAERVYNDGSPESIVFGIDAPWGIGKSSFINFCSEHWGKEYGEEIIVYKFNPLRYEDRSNLLEKFIDGLVGTIQKHIFLPEIRPLVSKYSRFIKGKASFSWSGLNLEVSPGSYTIDDAFEDLEFALKNI
ncbi:KAP family NTPase, partial [Candidatus Parcubacteria bacterium]|nr:KAP family NTPase [Candidatus Parcubacteria bacterium]